MRSAIGNTFPVDLRVVLLFWRLGRVTFLRLCRSLAQPPGSVAGDTSGGQDDHVRHTGQQTQYGEDSGHWSPGPARAELARNLPRKIERGRSEEHTSELQSLMRISYAVSCLKKTKLIQTQIKNDIKHDLTI